MTPVELLKQYTALSDFSRGKKKVLAMYDLAISMAEREQG